MSAVEKREVPRIDSPNLLSYVCLDENKAELTQGMGRTLNISTGGILLETHISMNPHQMIALTIAMEDDMIEIRGEVTHCNKRADGKFEIGVRFIEKDDAKENFLKQFIVMLDGHISY
jgi:c-di-GMP-binding flagellar brake protein YcgR